MQEVMHEPVKMEDIELCDLFEWIISSRASTLIRMTEYLDTQIQLCKNRQLLDLEQGSVIPAPRESGCEWLV